MASLATWEKFNQVSAKEEPRMDASTRFDTQIIGALPMILHYFERLQLSRARSQTVPENYDFPS